MQILNRGSVFLRTASVLYAICQGGLQRLACGLLSSYTENLKQVGLFLI
jgi:hypothetical protein